mmetsp:Transcript_7964/g.15189  ORF Transcript_7964/g.15189 Transcript_7964/m.15189 type:complete len:173 (-) Transcript_7964:65-583(-)|eukprot:scaffold175_cov177-Amphora_coffeaeformis.AAC.6
MRKVSLLGSCGPFFAVVVMAMMIGDRLDTTLAFSTPATVVANHRLVCHPYRHAPLFMSQDEPTKEDAKATSDDTPAATVVETFSSKEQEEEAAPYPLDVPSPILLASSMVIAIAATGSLFELIGSTPPQLGFAPTAAIVVIGYPVCLFLFYASVRKAIAETEEDDKKFLSGQ